MFNTVSNPVAAIETYIGFERKSALQLARRCALNFAAKSAIIKSAQNLIVKLKFHFDFLWKYEKMPRLKFSTSSGISIFENIENAILQRSVSQRAHSAKFLAKIAL